MRRRLCGECAEADGVRQADRGCGVRELLAGVVLCAVGCGLWVVCVFVSSEGRTEDKVATCAGPGKPPACGRARPLIGRRPADLLVPVRRPAGHLAAFVIRTAARRPPPAARSPQPGRRSRLVCCCWSLARPPVARQPAKSTLIVTLLAPSIAPSPSSAASPKRPQLPCPRLPTARAPCPADALCLQCQPHHHPRAPAPPLAPSRGVLRALRFRPATRTCTP